MEPGRGAPLRFPDVPKLELDQLLDQLVERAEDVKRTQGRLRALLRAIETVTSDLGLDTVLLNIIEAARDLSGAQYGGLGVLSPGGGLERFVHVGFSEADVAAIGRQPEGKGLIGALISDPNPIRLEHAAADARAVGFPDGHPPMTSFLGVPIHVRDEVFGNLYLSNAASGAFTVEDEELITALALAAGSAISNARLYEESRRQQQWLQASAEIGSQLLRSQAGGPLEMMVQRAYEIADADLVCLATLSADHTALLIEAAAGTGSDAAAGHRLQLTETVFGASVAAGDALRVADAGDPDERAVELRAFLDAGPALVLPLAGTGDVRGVLVLVRRTGRRRFTEPDLTMASAFASHASIALELAETRSTEQRLVLLEDRDRIAMDLHDHVIQELFAIGLGLESAATQIGADNPVSARLVSRVDDVDRVIKRIRTSIFELRGSLAVSADGLRQRISGLASELTSALGFTPSVSFTGAVDAMLGDELTDDITACVRESLTNVAKHAHASATRVEVSVSDGLLTVRVTDNGAGPGDSQRSSGTANLRARAEKHGGSYRIEPGSPNGTVVTWSARTARIG
jgi:signal transduction histidine kinase